MKLSKLVQLGALTFAIFLGSLNSVKAPALAENFNDVSEGTRHYMAVNYLREKGIISGYEDNSFKPKQHINRAEALKILTLASGKTTNEEIEALSLPEDDLRPFIDTPLDSWYIKYLLFAKENAIIGGYEDGSFKPEKSINLAETLKIYLESLENLEYPNAAEFLFADTPLEEWYTKYTAFAGSRGLLMINAANQIDPNQNMTRGYMAEIIYRMEKFKEGYEFGRATYYFGIPDGGNTYTTAHKTLPFGTIVEATNLANGNTVQATVTDRGPYGPGRVLDLSKTAFTQLAPLSTGVVDIQYKVIHLP